MAGMAQVRRITVVGEDILHRPCREVVEFGAGELVELVEDMFLTMKIAEGAGLAANQVGVDLRLFVYDCRDETGARHVGHVCNPVLEQQKVRRLADDKEGCLSVPGPYLRLARPDHAVVHGFDIYGSPVTVEGRGYFARCLQHETDHLNGHIYLDRLPEKTRRQALKEMAEKRAAIVTRRAARAAEHITNQANADTDNTTDNATTGKIITDKFSTDKALTGQAMPDIALTGQVTTDKALLGKAPTGQATTDRTPTNPPVDQANTQTAIPLGRAADQAATRFIDHSASQAAMRAADEIDRHAAGRAVEQMEGWAGEEAKGRTSKQVEARTNEQATGRTCEQVEAQTGEQAKRRTSEQVEAQSGEQATGRASEQVEGWPGVGSVERVVGR